MEKKKKYLNKLPNAERSYYYKLFRCLGYSIHSARRMRDFRPTKIRLVIATTLSNGETLINL